METFKIAICLLSFAFIFNFIIEMKDKIKHKKLLKKINNSNQPCQLIKNNSTTPTNNYENINKQRKDYVLNNISSLYSKKGTVINHLEQRAFFYCEQIIKELNLNNYYIFPQVSLYSFIDMTNKKRSSFQDKRLFDTIFQFISSKSIDILICKKEQSFSTYNYTPVLAIEIDGGGHGCTARQYENDNFKNLLFEQLNMPFLRIVTKDNYITPIEKEQIKNKLESLI